ncbi:MAG: hypothetical protein AB4426_11565 [Xenococcaceae cyanobacterium]
MAINKARLRQLHSKLAPIMVLPVLLTLITGSLFQVAVLTGKSNEFLWLLAEPLRNPKLYSKSQHGINPGKLIFWTGLVLFTDRPSFGDKLTSHWSFSKYMLLSV